MLMASGLQSPVQMIKGVGPQRANAFDHLDGRLERSEEHTSELQSPCNLVCRLLLEKKKKHLRSLPFCVRSGARRPYLQWVSSRCIALPCILWYLLTVALSPVQQCVPSPVVTMRPFS